MAGDAPIQNLDSIDLIGARRDGGADLMIVVSSFLSASAEHQKLLLDKLQNYLSYLNSPEFATELGPPSPESACIVLAFYHPPDPVILQLLEKCKGWLKQNNADLRMESHPPLRR